MQTYTYKGSTENDQIEVGEVNAASETEALQQLSAVGLTVFELQKSEARAAKPWYLRDVSFGSGVYSLSGTASLCEVMATLFDAHLTALDVLNITARSVDDPKLKRHLEHAIVNLQDGRPLPEAFFSGPIRFTPMLQIFLEVGENAADPGTVLKQAAHSFQQQATQQGKILSALIYPVILVVSALALLTLMIFFLAPNLSQIFEGGARELPPTLGSLMKIRAILSYSPVLSLTVIGITFAFLLTASRTARFREMIMQVFMYVPLLRRLRYQAASAHVSRHLSLLLNAGLPIAEALDAMASWGARTVLTPSLIEAAKIATEGGEIADVFNQNPAIPSMFTEVFRIGSQLNRLPQMLPAAASNLEASSEQSRERLMAMLTPALTLTIGGGIGFLVFSMMSAIMDINDLAF